MSDKTPEAVASNDQLGSLPEQLRAEADSCDLFGITKPAAMLRAAAEMIERLRAENFGLSAGQCPHVTSDEGGSAQCKQIAELKSAVAAERERWEIALKQTWQMVDPLKPAGQPGSYWRGQDAGITAALTTLRENLKTPRASVKRSEWVALSPEAQAKLLAMTGDPGPEYRRQQALGRERALKVPLGGAACPHTGQCHPGHCPCMESKA